MTFDDWCAAHGVYLNDSDDAARSAKLMARRAWDAAVAAEAVGNRENGDVAIAEAQMEIERLRTALENERRECNRAWREVGAIASAHKVHARWRAELAEKLHDAETELLKLRKVAVAFKELHDNAEEKECDGLGRWAQHGWWEAVDEAMEALAPNLHLHGSKHSKTTHTLTTPG